MRCPECRRQYSRFNVSPDAFRPTVELICPQCGAGLRVGWWPVTGFTVLAVVTALAVVGSMWLGIGDWVVRELGVSHRRILRTLIRATIGGAIGGALIAVGMYAIWVFGWYARRPGDAEQKPAATIDESDRMRPTV